MAKEHIIQSLLSTHLLLIAPLVPIQFSAHLPFIEFLVPVCDRMGNEWQIHRSSECSAHLPFIAS